MELAITIEGITLLVSPGLAPSGSDGPAQPGPQPPPQETACPHHPKVPISERQLIGILRGMGIPVAELRLKS